MQKLEISDVFSCPFYTRCWEVRITVTFFFPSSVHKVNAQALAVDTKTSLACNDFSDFVRVQDGEHAFLERLYDEPEGVDMVQRVSQDRCYL